MTDKLEQLITNYKADLGSVYNTWFINNDDKAESLSFLFAEVQQVINDIKENKFPNDFKESKDCQH